MKWASGKLSKPLLSLLISPVKGEKQLNSLSLPISLPPSFLPLTLSKLFSTLISSSSPSRGNWGPHLIIVPTSVLLNWELELKKWCPAFKILTYFGSFKERKQKRVVSVYVCARVCVCVMVCFSGRDGASTMRSTCASPPTTLQCRTTEPSNRRGGNTSFWMR